MPTINAAALCNPTHIDLTWTNIPVGTNFEILKCVGAGCTPNTVIRSDTANNTSNLFSDLAVFNFQIHRYLIRFPNGNFSQTPVATALANCIFVPPPGVTLSRLPATGSAEDWRFVQAVSLTLITSTIITFLMGYFIIEPRRNVFAFISLPSFSYRLAHLLSSQQKLGSNWTPAFAGMTSKEDQSRKSKNYPLANEFESLSTADELVGMG